MKLVLNDRQKAYVKEILQSSEVNAARGNDIELALAFRELYDKVKVENAAYINLKRADAESISDFCESVATSLNKALEFLESDITRSKEVVDDLKEKTLNALAEITGVISQIKEKIAQNPQ
jgi:phage tail tape-measure protein